MLGLAGSSCQVPPSAQRCCLWGRGELQGPGQGQGGLEAPSQNPHSACHPFCRKVTENRLPSFSFFGNPVPHFAQPLNPHPLNPQPLNIWLALDTGSVFKAQPQTGLGEVCSPRNGDPRLCLPLIRGCSQSAEGREEPSKGPAEPQSPRGRQRRGGLSPRVGTSQPWLQRRPPCPPSAR